MTDYPAPPDDTALRMAWRFLPPTLRAWIEEQCGAPVVDAVSQDAGFTPAFASVLTCADGTRHFVKAASVQAQRTFAASYREEGRVLAALPASVPAPQLRWMLDDDWVVLGIEHVDGTSLPRPWQHEHVDAALDALEAVARELTPAPDLGLAAVAEELSGWAGLWSDLADGRPGIPRLSEAAALAAEFAQVGSGDTLVHTDVRADNLLLTGDGRVAICDWNWPVRGPAWIDSVMLLVGVRGDGLDVDRHLRDRPLLAGVDPNDIDRLLAVLSGYLLTQGALPVQTASPYLRAHQEWSGWACWDWLAARRGWPAREASTPDLGG